MCATRVVYTERVMGEGEGEGQDAHVEDGRSLVALRDRMVSIVRELRTADDMAPEHAHAVAALGRYHLVRHRLLEVAVARDVAVVHVLQRVVGQRCADADSLAVIVAVDAGKGD